MDRAAAAPHDPVLLFDGVCGLCNRAVNFLLAIDRARRLRYAPLQGETAAMLRATHAEIPADLDSVVLVTRGKVYLRSQAFVHGARFLPYPWRLALWLRWVPAWLLDIPYRLLARVRYRVFGKLDACRLPRPGERELFLP